MRAKRAKQYKKLMQEFSHFGFREPYQTLVDANLVKDVSRFKMELQAALDRTLRGKAKPMITQCCIRHLYAQASEPGMAEVIDLAKTLERRRCGHHPEQYPEPLPTLECLKAVVDPQSNGTNKHNYVVASQSQEVRQAMRGVRGVPLIYVARSVMLMEPISAATAQVRNRDEASKFREGIRKLDTGQKRKRDDADGSKDEEGDEDGAETQKPTAKSSAQGVSLGPKAGEPERKKKKKKYGPKGPNPLAVQKSKKAKQQDGGQGRTSAPARTANVGGGQGNVSRKRRRRSLETHSAS